MSTPFVQHIQQTFHAFSRRLKPGHPVGVLCHNEFVRRLGFGPELQIVPITTERQHSNNHE